MATNEQDELKEIKNQLKELTELLQNQSENNRSLQNQLPQDVKARLIAVEKKITRVEKRLAETTTPFDLARDFTWHELKNICVKSLAQGISFYFAYLLLGVVWERLLKLDNKNSNNNNNNNNNDNKK